MEPVSIPNTQADVHVVLHAVLAPDTTDQPRSVVREEVTVSANVAALVDASVRAVDPAG